MASLPSESFSNGIVDAIGDTPLIELKSLSKLTGRKIFGKCEFLNPGGSVKDRPALRMVEEAEKFKEQDRIMRDIADARNVLNDYAYVVVRECVHFDITHY